MKISREEKLMQKIIETAWESESFKTELIRDPRGAIKKLTGEKVIIPEGKKLIVRDQTDDRIIYINIPTEKKIDDLELNEEQLEAIAGGKSFSVFDSSESATRIFGRGGTSGNTDWQSPPLVDETDISSDNSIQ